MDPSQDIARRIVMRLGESGTPPDIGVSHFTVGLESILETLDDEYLGPEFGAVGKLQLSAFKLVVGSYGGGKTHLLYSIRDLAWRRGFVASYVPLSPSECPFDRLDLVYKQTVANLMYPQQEGEEFVFGDSGVEAFFKSLFVDKRASMAAETADEEQLSEMLHEYARTIAGTESGSVSHAARAAFVSQIKGDDETFEAATRWLKGEGYDRKLHGPLGITEKIDKASAFRMLRSIAQLLNVLGFSGLVLLFDEAERALSLQSSKSRIAALDNLRQLVDECGNARLPSCMIFYAVPNSQDLLGGGAPVYEALRGRLEKIFRQDNPTAPQIDLESLDLEPTELLRRIGGRLAKIYGIAYGIELNTAAAEHNASVVAQEAHEMRYADIGYRRLFVKNFMEALHHMRREPSWEMTSEEARTLLSTGLADLTEKEIAAVDERPY
jgi:hypothetical protein